MFILKAVTILCSIFKITYKFYQQVSLFSEVTVQDRRTALLFQTSATLPFHWQFSKILQIVSSLESVTTLNYDWKLIFVVVGMRFNRKNSSTRKTYHIIDDFIHFHKLEDWSLGAWEYYVLEYISDYSNTWHQNLWLILKLLYHIFMDFKRSIPLVFFLLLLVLWAILFWNWEFLC